MSRPANPLAAVPTGRTSEAPGRDNGHPGDEPEFLGLTKTDCPVDCDATRCAIGGSLVFKNDDGTTSLVGHCCHPFKGGLGPIHQTRPEIVQRFNRARRALALAEAEAKDWNKP